MNILQYIYVLQQKNVWCQRKPDKSVESLGNGVTVGCEHACVHIHTHKTITKRQQTRAVFRSTGTREVPNGLKGENGKYETREKDQSG